MLNIPWAIEYEQGEAEQTGSVASEDEEKDKEEEDEEAEDGNKEAAEGGGRVDWSWTT